MTTTVLIAHAKGEEAVAEKLAEPIRAAGYNVAYDGSVDIGDSQIGSASKFLSQYVPVVVCATINAMGTRWTKQVANAARNAGAKVFIVEMEQGVDTDAIAFNDSVARYWKSPSQAEKDLVSSLRKHYPPNADADGADDAISFEVKFADLGRILHLTNQSPVARSARKNLFLRHPRWELVCGDAYASRPAVFAELVSAFDRFIAQRQLAKDDLKLPVFWIGGRSGDGKSVLLLQLLRHVISQPDAPTVFMCGGPNDAVRLLSEFRTGMSGRFVIAVDDLHKASDWSAASHAIEHAANVQCDLVLLTCGPTPERTSFIRDKRSLVADTNFDTPDLSQADAVAIGQHLGVWIEAPNEKPPTLVEQVYWGLGGEHDLSRFAASLRERVDSEQEGLLAEVAALTWIDVPFPVDQINPLVKSRIEELAEQTQLHFEEVPGGYRFGHPALVKPIFDALTAERDRNIPLAVRLAKALSSVLRSMDPALHGLVINQIPSRLEQDPGVSPVDVLTALHGFCRSSNIGACIANTTVFRFDRLRLPSAVEQQWISIARTFRDNRSTEPITRARLATALATRERPENRDLDIAYRFLSESKLASHMGYMLTQLLVRKEAQRFLGPAIEWAAKHFDNRTLPNVVEAMLARHHADSRVRHLARRFIAQANVEDLRAQIVSVLSRHFEEESETLIRRWISLRRSSTQAGQILTDLVAKSGSPWIDLAFDWLKALPRRDQAWFRLAGTVIRKIEADHPFADEMRVIAGEAISIDESGELFEAFSERVGELDVSELLEQRIEARWGHHDALSIFAKIWRHSGSPNDRMMARLEQATNWAVELSQPDRPPSKLYSVAANMLVSISTNVGDPSWVPYCLKYLQAVPNGPYSARIAGHLLSSLAVANNGNQRPLDAAEQAFVIEVAWRHAEDEKIYGPDRAGALVGLIRLLWPAEAGRLREAIRLFFDHKVVRGSDFVLGAWLSLPQSRAEAMQLLLDDSVKQQNRIASRAAAAVGNMEVIFDALREPTILEKDAIVLCELLQSGIGDYERRQSAAREAWSRFSMWPDIAVPYLWRGIVRSSIVGSTMRRDLFWPEFKAWYNVSRDKKCSEILAGAGVGL